MEAKEVMIVNTPICLRHLVMKRNIWKGINTRGYNVEGSFNSNLLMCFK